MTAENGILAAGAKAPPFTLPLIGGEGSGDSTSFSVPPAGTPGLTLMAFYKSACPTCRLTFPFLQVLHEQVSLRGGRVVGVSQDGPEQTASLAGELGLALPLAVDGVGLPVSREYGLVFVPTLYLLASDGTILRGTAGFSKKELRAMAGSLAASVGAPPPDLFGEDGSVPETKPG